jgi:hypothetical protein
MFRIIVRYHLAARERGEAHAMPAATPEVVTTARAARLVGVSEKTMLRWLNAEPPKVRGAHKVSPVGLAERREVPVASLDGLKRTTLAARGDELAELRARVQDLEARLAVLEARPPARRAALPDVDPCGTCRAPIRRIGRW